MRIAALVLGILSGFFSAMLGIKWIADADENRKAIEAARSLGVDVAQVEALVRSGYCLLGTFVLAIVGGVLAMKGKGKAGGAVMLAGVVLPAIFDAKSLLATGLLAIAALLAALSKPKSEPLRVAATPANNVA